MKKLRASRELAMRQREDLQSLPLAKADFEELLESWVDRKGSGFAQRLQVGAAYYLRNPMAALPENVKAPTSPMVILTACSRPDEMATVAGLEANLFYVLAPAIKEGIRRVLDEMDFTDAGPPRADRVEMIQALDAKIVEFDSREAFGSGRSGRNKAMNETDVAQVLIACHSSFRGTTSLRLSSATRAGFGTWHASSPASR